MGKIAQIKAPNYTTSPCVLHCLVISLKCPWWSCKEILISLNLDPWVHVFFDTMYDTDKALLLHAAVTVFVSRKSTWVIVSWTGHFFHGSSFVPEVMTKRLWQTLSCKRKKKWTYQFKLIDFVGHDKFQVFKLKLEFWKTCTHHHELEGFPVLKDWG